MTTPLQILASDGRALLYRPELNPLCGSVTATILFSRILFWFTSNNEKDFYKFKEPCGNPLYREGDSWVEELGISAEAFDRALGKIGFQLKRAYDDLIGAELEVVQKAEENALVHYWIDKERVTHYTVNVKRVETALEEIYRKKKRSKEQKEILVAVEKAEAIALDEQDAFEIKKEIEWRMRNEYKAHELRAMFGEDADLPAEIEYLAEKWLETEGKTLVVHPKSGKIRHLEYQSCLRGFKQWVATFSRNRNDTPPESRKMHTPIRQFEVEKQAILTVCKAWGRVSWRLAHPERAARGLEWEIDENKIVAFLKIPGYTVEQKQAYLCYNAIKRPGLRYRDLDEVFRDGIDSEEMNKALTLYDRSIWLGRPWNFSKYPPEYPAPYLQMPYYTSESFKADIPENFFVEHDKLHPPTWLHDSEGNPIKK